MMQVTFGTLFQRKPEIDSKLAVQNFNKIQQQVAQKVEEYKQGGLGVEGLSRLAQATGVRVNYFA